MPIPSNLTCRFVRLTSFAFCQGAAAHASSLAEVRQCGWYHAFYGGSTYLA